VNFSNRFLQGTDLTASGQEHANRPFNDPGWGQVNVCFSSRLEASRRRPLRILLVEDERKVAKALQEGLEAESYSIAVAHTGEEGFSRVSSEPFDLVVLDVMLPGRSGIEMLSAMRSQGIRIPVLLLTAKDTLADRVLGLDAGADDYLVKPFAFPELSARIRALLRRGKTASAVSLRINDLQMDLASRTVTRGTRTLDLTAKEFELLEYLLRHKGHVVSREMLATDVWKETMRPTPLDNVIDVHMVRIRRKVDEGFSTRLVHTVRGVGFVLKAEKK
jgi:two-component system, OmpR family, copper resistance phosphate regulon response regulator CusR